MKHYFLLPIIIMLHFMGNLVVLFPYYAKPWWWWCTDAIFLPSFQNNLSLLHAYFIQRGVLHFRGGWMDGWMNVMQHPWMRCRQTGIKQRCSSEQTLPFWFYSSLTGVYKSSADPRRTSCHTTYIKLCTRSAWAGLALCRVMKLERESLLMIKIYPPLSPSASQPTQLRTARTYPSVHPTILASRRCIFANVDIHAFLWTYNSMY